MITKARAQRRRRLLTRTFFDRMFENDLFSSSVSASYAVMWLLAALATPGVMFSGSQYYFYAHARTFDPAALDRILFVSEVFHVGFAMAIAGVITALVWTSIAPDRRDALVLGALPVSDGEQARARLLALLRFFVMFAAAVSVPTAFAFTFVTVGDGAAAEVPARIAGHVTATLGGAAFVFFLLVGLQVVLAAVFGPRAVRAAAWPLQAAVIVGMVSALSMTDHLATVIRQQDAFTQGWVALNPAAWFVGVYRWVAGDPREIFWLLASRGLLVTAMLAGGVLVLYPLAYRRCLTQAIAAEGRRANWWTGGPSRFWLRVLRPLLPTPLERGVAAFMVASLTRSHTHRFLVGSYLGLALLFALPLMARLLLPASSAGVRYAWFAVPLGVVCWAAAAMRVAMMLPIEPSANWIFKLTEPVDKARIVATAVVVTQSTIVAPVAVVFAIAAWLAGGLPLGASVAGVVAMTGSALVELLMLTLRTIPGACTYRPGQLRLRTLWPLYLAIWVSIAYVLPTVAVRALDAGSAPALIGTLAAAWFALRTWRVRRSRRLAAFVYEELEPETSTTVRLGPAGA